MYPIIRNIFAFIVGIAIGMVVNMSIIHYGPVLIPPPEGVDVTDVENFNKNIHLFEAKHFIMPFLAHALGTLVGALAVAMLAVKRQRILALGIGGFFLLGGIAAASMIKAPMWFTGLDLVLAYIPMGFLGWKLVAVKEEQRGERPSEDILDH